MTMSALRRAANQLMNMLLFEISGFMRCRIIKSEGMPYLERYFVCRIGQRMVYLHRFLASDPDELHNHPFNGVSFILCGHYYEERRWGADRFGWFNVVLADTFHRVVLPRGVHVWTLFCHGPRVDAPWGMLRRIPGEDEDARLFVPYQYDAEGNNESARGWWKTYPRGNKSKREKVDYVGQ